MISCFKLMVELGQLLLLHRTSSGEIENIESDHHALT
jgi:hypothetical protein